MDFKKSRFSSSLNSIPGLKMGMDLRDGSETGVGNNIFLVWNRVRILRNWRLTPTKNSREYPHTPWGTLEQPWEQRWPLLLLTSEWPEKKTSLCWDRVVLNRTLVTRGFFSGAAGCFGVAAGQQIFGRRQKDQKSLEAKTREKKLFTRVTLNGFTKPETAHKKSPGTQANWTAVLEKIYWRCVFPMEPRQNRELKLWKRQILSNSRLRCKKQRSLSWTQKCTKGLDSRRNQS